MYFNIGQPAAKLENAACFIHEKFGGAVVEEVAATSSDSPVGKEDGKISHSNYVKTATEVKNLASQLRKAIVHLDVQSVMVVTKARDNSLVYLTREITEWLISGPKTSSASSYTSLADPSVASVSVSQSSSVSNACADMTVRCDKPITVYVDHKLKTSKRFNAAGLEADNPAYASYIKYWDPEMARTSPNLFDLVITLGGDGTVLYVSGLFQEVVPPVIAFRLGSLGFLTNFKFEHFRSTLNSIFHDGFKVNLRLRFLCCIYNSRGELVGSHQVLNEIVVDRGPSPWISMLELYGDGNLLTVVQADGLILSTPTGSTAYSLSAGGSLVHPEVSAIAVTPICPHTLSFRPMLLPDSMKLRVSIPAKSRSTAWASFDGANRTELRAGDYVEVSVSQFPFPTIIYRQTDYIESVSRTLKWNVREHQRPFAHLLSKKNKLNYQKLEDGLKQDDRKRENDGVSGDEDEESSSDLDLDLDIDTDPVEIDGKSYG